MPPSEVDQPEPSGDRPPQAGHTQTIARNSFWWAIDITFSYFLVFFTSIPIARVIGPERLGYYQYVQFMVRMATLMGTMGLATTVRKYMAEHLGRGQGGLVRSIFYNSLWLQGGLSLPLTVAGLILVFTAGDPGYRWISAVLVVCILPQTLLFIPSQANMARENMAANMPGNIIGSALYAGVVVLSLTRGWGLLGVACGLLLGRSAEFFIKLLPVTRWLKDLGQVRIPPDLRRRMLAFSVQSVALMLLRIVVWDRSDVLFLKMLASDIAQLTFYTLAISLTEQLMNIPRAFAYATGMTLMAQYGRGEKGMYPLAAESARYTGLMACPILVGLAVLSGPAIRILYGSQYLPVIPVLAVAAILAIPKALLYPGEQLLIATENLGFLVRWTLCCAVVNILLDLALIPSYGALGAAVANGGAQTLGVLGIWGRAVRLFELKIPYASLARIALSSAVMAAVVLPAALFLGPWLAAAVAIPAGGLVFFFMLKVTGALEVQDRKRLLQFRNLAPEPVRPWFDGLLDFMIPVQNGR